MYRDIKVKEETTIGKNESGPHAYITFGCIKFKETGPDNEGTTILSRVWHSMQRKQALMHCEV